MAIVNAIQRLLESCGYCTETFGSGRAFLDSLHDHSPDCVLLDLLMLGMTGWDVQAEMAACGSSIPIIFITGDADPGVLKKVKNTAAVGLLRKPFGQRELLEIITPVIP